MTKSCLIVDDSRLIRSVTRRMIEDLFGSIEEAENGQLALDACIKQMPTVVILDWNMPVMTGIEFLKKLRSLESANQPKVIFCTTENELSKIQEAIGSGADEYIMKPFDREILEAKLVQVGVL